MNDPSIVAGQYAAPSGLQHVANAPDPCGTATADGDYPYVFNNDAADPSFGVTSPIRLLQLTPDGRLSARSRCRTAPSRGLPPPPTRW